MKKLLKWLEAALTAVAFAEEGDVETARRIMAEASSDGTPPGGCADADPERRWPGRRRLPGSGKIARTS